VNADFDVIVIGAGAADASATYQLSKRGLRVLTLEQFAIGHDRGSKHGHSRIFRFAYDQVIYARMAMWALELWRDLGRDAVTQLYWPTGMLDFGGNDAPKINRIEVVMREINSPFEILDLLAMNSRFLQWRPRDDWKIIFLEFAGIVSPILTLEVLIRLAREHGAKVMQNTPVLEVDLSDPKNPSVKTEHSVFTAEKLVITAGAWLPKLVPGLERRFKVQDNLTAFFRPRYLEAFDPEKFPVFIQRDDEQVYGFPNFGLSGVKVAFHATGEIVDPDVRTVIQDDPRVAGLHKWLETYIPDAAGMFMQSNECMYSNTSNDDFVIDFHPASSNTVIASPCSGHGFKFTPILGEILADMVQGNANKFIADQFKIKSVTT
jgi:sarcosine oxidase